MYRIVALLCFIFLSGCSSQALKTNPANENASNSTHPVARDVATDNSEVTHCSVEMDGSVGGAYFQSVTATMAQLGAFKRMCDHAGIHVKMNCDKYLNY